MIERVDDVGNRPGGGKYGDEDAGCDGQWKPVGYHQRGQNENVGESEKNREGREGWQNEQVPITAS